MQDCNIFEVWEQYKKKLYVFIQKRVHNQDDAKDILQNVLLNSYQFCAKGKEVLYLKSWLFKITQNAIIDFHKKSNQSLPLNFDIAQEDVPSSSYSEASEYIKTVLRLLPVEYSVPLKMYDLDGVEQNVIAQKLGIGLSATKSRIQRGRLKLKEQFLKCCKLEFDEKGELISLDIQPHCKELLAQKQQLENNT